MDEFNELGAPSQGSSHNTPSNKIEPIQQLLLKIYLTFYQKKNQQ